jgi:hypothetical protein
MLREIVPVEPDKKQPAQIEGVKGIKHHQPAQQ